MTEIEKRESQINLQILSEDQDGQGERPYNFYVIQKGGKVIETGNIRMDKVGQNSHIVSGNNHLDTASENADATIERWNEYLQKQGRDSVIVVDNLSGNLPVEVSYSIASAPVSGGASSGLEMVKVTDSKFKDQSYLGLPGNGKNIEIGHSLNVNSPKLILRLENNNGSPALGLA